MPSAKQHYDTLLGDHYRWSVAGDADPYELGAAWLARHDLAGAARYLDLGAGFGAHAVPLARLGASVTAVDFHAGLLATLRAAAPTVTTHESDLLAFLSPPGVPPTSASPTVATSPSAPPVGAPWDAILCLGDTLTHLASPADAQRLIVAASHALAPGGQLALSYRDYSGPPRTGLDRFIPVRADATRALICCLDPLDADHITVTDLLTITAPGGLRTQLSSYPKLRLAPTTVAAWATSAGLTLDRTSVEHGLHLQVFIRAV